VGDVFLDERVHGMMSVQQELRDYIVDNILFGDGEKLDEDVSLQKAGILDSTGFLEIITFMEERFAIEIADVEVVPENFDTLRRIAAFVEQKMGARAGV
jgi:acyl carrier protein